MAILTAATAGVVTAMLYSGLGDKVHKLLGFKFCKFSPETAQPEAEQGEEEEGGLMFQKSEMLHLCLSVTTD